MREKLMNVMKYVFLSLLVCILVMLTGNFNVMAADGDTFTVGGLKYEVIDESNKTVRITGYTSVSANLTIPASVKNGTVTYAVTEIGEAAFAENTTITSVTISEGIELLEGKAFGKCTNLSKVTLPNSLTEADTAYSSAWGGWCGPFTGCSKLATVNLPSKMTKVPNNLFRGATGISGIVIPNTVTEIGDAAFSDCTGLKNITLSSNLRKIGAEAFYKCTGLTGITLPKSLAEADSNYSSSDGGWCGPFTGCTNLSSIQFETGTTSIPGDLFANCAGIKTIAFPSTVTVIGNAAFLNCSNLKTINFSNNIVTIEDEAFAGCTQLTGLVLPSRLKKMESMAFGNCTALTSVTIPKSVTECGSSYKSDFGGWVGPFGNCTALKTVTFEEGMTTIPSNVLLKCTGVTNIVFPKTITKIGSSAFSGCKNLLSIVIPSTVTEIGEEAFAEMNIVSITIPSSVKSIGDGIVKNCTLLKEITISAPITEIKYEFAYGCTSLTKVNFPAYSITQIGSGAFYGCTSLETLALPKSVTTLGHSVFKDCTGLSSMVLPSQIRKMGDSVFEGCEKLEKVTLSAGITEIPYRTFKNCSALTSADIPYRVTKVGAEAYDTCYSLTNIAIPKSVTEISSSAFSYPGSMIINGISGSYAQTFANENDAVFTAKTVATTGITLHNSKLLSSSTLSASVGDSYTVIAALTPVSSTQGVTWTSGNTKVATVDANGTVKAVAGGTATITAKSGNVSASFKILVRVPLTGLKLNSSSVTFNAVGGYTTLTATKAPTNTSESVVWTSSDTKVATVDANGKVVAKGVGSAVITATGNESKSVKATCKITVKNLTLATPSITVKSEGYDRLKISWGKVTNATGYQIYRYNSKTKQYEKVKDITSGNTTSYTNTGLGGYEYKYKVKAVMTSYNKTVYSALSAYKAARPKPNQITGLKQSGYTTGSISLKWTKQSGVSGYQIVKCSSANGTYTTVKTLTSNTASYTNTNCKSGTNYYYKVRAFKTNGSGTKIYGDYSTPVKMTTKPGATTVSLSKASGTSIKISWTKTTGSTNYEVYMATSKNGTYTKIKTVQSGKTLSFTKTGLTKGKTYYFKVRSYKTNANGEKVYSGWSTIKSKSL